MSKILSSSLNLRERVLVRLFLLVEDCLVEPPSPGTPWHQLRPRLNTTWRTQRRSRNSSTMQTYVWFVPGASPTVVTCCYGYVGYVVLAEGSRLLWQVTCPKSKRIGLRYLTELVRSGRPLPRRQELESKTFVPPNSEEAETALVSHQEVQTWAEGNRDAIICSISHAWETREHPDPCRYQLEHIVNCVVLYEAAFKADVWVFYDYASLFQFERLCPKQQSSFGAAMQNMHVMYAHEHTLTLRIESLTYTRWCLESHDGQRDGTCPCLWQRPEMCCSQTFEGFGCE